MSSKWKYANLDALHRIELLEKGNKELFDEEVARTKEITNARRELGLDTSEQEQWMDRVGKAYSSAISDGASPVSETGYAELYLGEKKADSETSSVKRRKNGISAASSYIYNAKAKIDNAMEIAKNSARERNRISKENAREELYGKYPHLEETLINQGASPAGGKIKRAYELIENQLSMIYSDLDTKLENELVAIENKYSGMKNKISDYWGNGVTLNSLGVLADALIMNAAREDGYSFQDVSGTGEVRQTVKRYGSSEESEESDADKAEIAKNYAASKANKEKNSVTASVDEDKDEQSDSDGEFALTQSDKEGNIYAEIGEIADNIKKNPTKSAEGISKLLVNYGFSVTDALKTAAELLTLFSKVKTAGT